MAVVVQNYRQQTTLCRVSSELYPTTTDTTRCSFNMITILLLIV